MALTQDQITNLAQRVQLMEGLFAVVLQALSVIPGAESIPAKQLASQTIRTSIRAMKQVVADPIAALPAPYTEPELEALANGLSVLRSVAERLMQGLAKAQTPLLVNEDGSTVRDYTLVQKDAMETELRRLYAKMTTILNAAP